MPHIIIEHSEDLPVLPQVLVEKIHTTAFESNLFELETIKTRAIAYQQYQLGAGKLRQHSQLGTNGHHRPG